MKKDYQVSVEVEPKTASEAEIDQKLNQIFEYIVREIGMKDEYFVKQLTGE